MMPQITGTSFRSPRAKVSTKMAVTKEMNASAQLVLAMFTALPDNDNPMRMITGPMTTGGNTRSNKCLPCHFTKALITKYTSDTLVRPANVPGSPHCSVAEMIGAMKANELPKKMGTLPLVTKWKMNVPSPAVKSAVDGLIPTSNGTRTVAPTATKRNCTPTIVFFVLDRVSIFISVWSRKVV